MRNGEREPRRINRNPVLVGIAAVTIATAGLGYAKECGKQVPPQAGQVAPSVDQTSLSNFLNSIKTKLDDLGGVKDVLFPTPGYLEGKLRVEPKPRVTTPEQ